MEPNKIKTSLSEYHIVFLIVLRLHEFPFWKQNIIRSGMNIEHTETSEEYPDSQVDEKSGDQHLNNWKIYIEDKPDDESKPDKYQNCSPKNSCTHFHNF